MRFIVDRITDGIASLEAEDRSIVEVPAKLLPKGIKEGEVISITINKEETKAREERIKALMEDVWAD